MKKRDAEAQFAAAWIYDGRQVLCYLWCDHGQEDGYYVRHMTTDPTLRLAFDMQFPDSAAAWKYFHHIRTSSGEGDENIRVTIEGIFDSLFEKAGKDYEQEEGRNEDEDDTEDPPFEN